MIYLLIGQKGSGKSFIGALFEQQFGIKFVRVEDWAKALRKKRDVLDEEYVSEVFQTIEMGIRDAMLLHSSVVFESTGLTPYFDQMLYRLQADYKVTTIRIKADLKTCMDRIQIRDAAIHIPIPLDQIEAINRQISKKNMPTAFTIINNDESKDALQEKIAQILMAVGR